MKISNSPIYNSNTLNTRSKLNRFSGVSFGFRLSPKQCKILEHLKTNFPADVKFFDTEMLKLLKQTHDFSDKRDALICNSLAKGLRLMSKELSNGQILKKVVFNAKASLYDLSAKLYRVKASVNSLFPPKIDTPA